MLRAMNMQFQLMRSSIKISNNKGRELCLGLPAPSKGKA
jgi:hypothetical protein